MAIVKTEEYSYHKYSYASMQEMQGHMAQMGNIGYDLLFFSAIALTAEYRKLITS